MSEWTSHDDEGEDFYLRPSSATAMSFQDGVTNLLVQTEELRRKLGSLEEGRVVSTGDCFRMLHDVDEVLARLYSPPLTTHAHYSSQPVENEDEIEIENELRNHCLQKARTVAMQALKLAARKKESDPEDEEEHDAEEERECQSAMARLAELNLVLCCDGDTEGNKDSTKRAVDEIIGLYASYQKQVIRQRAKPSIARLVEFRKRQTELNGMIVNGSEEDEDGNQSPSRQHIQVLTTILGQATALIHPLMMWRSNLHPKTALFQLCSSSIATLDEQAQTLAKTVATWFMEDSRIDDYWTVQMSAVENNHDGYDGSYSSDRPVEIDLSDLDSVVDQLAFCCQIFDRYMQFVVNENEHYSEDGNNSNSNSSNSSSNNNGKDNNRTTILKELSPEWTWKYASLERFLTTQQLRSALHPSNNSPVEIIVGASVQVPSVVEDAQYLSTRALKRAASTRSDQAIGTVAHSIASDVWTTDAGGKGIHEALVEQRGCYDPRSEESSIKGSKSSSFGDVSGANTGGINASPPRSGNFSNSFAQALLGALDEGTGSSSSSSPIKSVANAPSSGGLLGTLSSSLASSVTGGDVFLEVQLGTHLCALNGIRSASAACSSLVEFLDSLLLSDEEDDSEQNAGGGSNNNSNNNDNNNNNNNNNNNSMVHLAREELFRFSRTYDELLRSQAVRIVRQFCGGLHDSSVYKGSTVVPVLRYYLERESFDIPDARHLSIAEDDARLYKKLIQPMNDCKLLQRFEKCDVGVLRALCQEIARVLGELFLDVVTSSSVPKRFTDWGSLLFSKEVRTVQNHLQSLMQRAVSTAAASHQDQAGAVPVLTPQWERLSQAVTILQLEKPSDWSVYYQSTSVFSPKELHRILSLRVDFSSDAVRRVVASLAESVNEVPGTNGSNR